MNNRVPMPMKSVLLISSMTDDSMLLLLLCTKITQKSIGWKICKKIVEKVLWIGKKVLPLQPLSWRGGADMSYLGMWNFPENSCLKIWKELVKFRIFVSAFRLSEGSTTNKMLTMNRNWVVQEARWACLNIGWGPTITKECEPSLLDNEYDRVSLGPNRYYGSVLDSEITPFGEKR